MLTYRSRDSFESRFGRKLQPPPKADGMPNKAPRAAEASGQQGHYNPDQVRDRDRTRARLWRVGG